MCGRYNLKATPAELKEFFALFREDTFAAPPRSNIKPTTDILVIRREDDDARHIVPMRWGLVPSWARELKSSGPLINARADTIADKPSFRTAFKKRRCLIPASGYYEWSQDKKKQPPFLIRHSDNRLMAFAGIWEQWTKGPAPLLSCALITTEANAHVSTVHDRMPVLLAPEHWEIWLDPELEGSQLQELLAPYTGEDLQISQSPPLTNDPQPGAPAAPTLFD